MRDFVFRARLVMVAFSFGLGFQCAGRADAEERKWTDTNGREILGELLSYEDGVARLLVGGKEFDVPGEKLSEQDRDFLSDWLEKREAERMIFQGVTLAPGEDSTFDLPTTGDEKMGDFTCLISLPDDFSPDGEYTIFLVNVPSGRNATEAVGGFKGLLNHGCILLAIDRTESQYDTDTQSVLSLIWEKWPRSNEWPVAMGGNSGGAKRSIYSAANLTNFGANVVGVFMGGCNEDRTGDAMEWIKMKSAEKERFKKVGMFLSSGVEDKVATPDQVKAVKESLENAGFENVRLEPFEGGHGLHREHLSVALDWFHSLREE